MRAGQDQMDHIDIFKQSCPWRMPSGGHLPRCLPADSGVAVGSGWPELQEAWWGEGGGEEEGAEGRAVVRAVHIQCWRRPD